MFINSREEFNDYLTKNKKPLMATFYKGTRQRLNILMKKDGNPEGGKWSFDEDNRKKLPKNIKVPKFPNIIETKHTKSIKNTKIHKFIYIYIYFYIFLYSLFGVSRWCHLSLQSQSYCGVGTRTPRTRPRQSVTALWPAT